MTKLTPRQKAEYHAAGVELPDLSELDTPPRQQPTARQLAKQLGIPYIEEPFGAATSRPARRPTPVMEPAPRAWDGPDGIMIDRFDVNPGVTFYKKVMPGHTFPRPVPTMFALGDLPPFTASGIDPEQLYFVPWSLRHAAAVTVDRQRVLQFFEEGSDGMTADMLQTREGLHAFREYVYRVQAWAFTLPDDPKLSSEDVAKLYPPGRQP